MSVFKVQLNNVGQGLLDLDPSSAKAGFLGTQLQPSSQRQVYVMGPKKINRLLKDGQTFTDCNYWKRFAYPNVPYDQAIVSVVTDDGSVYSDVPSENTFGVGQSFTLTTSLADNVVDFVNGTIVLGGAAAVAFPSAGPATFLQIQNTHATIALTGELNGSTSLVFTLPAAQVQIFDNGDLSITMLRLKSASSNGTALMLGACRSVINS